MSDESSVDRLKKKLYARGKGPSLRPRRDLHDQVYDVPTSWMNQEDVQAQHKDLELDPEQELEELRHGYVRGMSPQERAPAILSDERVSERAVTARNKKRLVTRAVKSFFWAAAIFFVLAAGIAYYVFVWGGNQVSCDKLVIKASGPVSVPSGKALSLNISIDNKNAVSLENADLVINYPDGARNADNPAVLLPSVREPIGVLDPDQPVNAEAHAILYGKEQTQQHIGMTVEYGLKGSNATFKCSTNYDVLISTAPVSLAIDGLEEVSSGQEVTLTATITSNSNEVVPDQRLVVDYPFGYQYEDASPEPTMANNVWDIGDVAPGSVRTITIKGVVSAQSTESRAVKFSLGTRDPDHADEVATVLQGVDHALLITSPFLKLDLALNDSIEPTVAVAPGDNVTGKVAWRNTLPYKLNNVTIEAALPGPFVVPASVRVQQGYFRSVDRTIVWTPQTNPALAEIDPGASGVLHFSFITQQPAQDTNAANPSMDIAFAVSAQRSEGGNEVDQKLVAQAKRTIKFISNLTFDPQIVYGIGPFSNTGPYPPRADQETTYTVMWKINNTTNALDNVTVRGTLPVYAKWEDRVDPSTENVTYNPTTREVLWTVGSVARSTGSQEPTKQVSFQISAIPSVTQIGSEITLVENPTIHAVDHFTGSVLEQKKEPLTSKLTNDPYFTDPYGRVLK